MVDILALLRIMPRAGLTGKRHVAMRRGLMLNSDLLIALLAPYGPVILSFGIAAAGAWWARRRVVWAPGIYGLSIAAGWALLFPAPWREILWPRGTAGHLLLPVLVLAGAELLQVRVRSRWLAVGAVGVVTWWLAGSPAGRPEFWRVAFGSTVAAWVLARAGAGEPRRGLATALALWGGLLVGGAPQLWRMAMLAMAAGCVGVQTAGRGLAVSSNVLMLGVVGAELVGGRAVHGRLGVVDLVSASALGVPWAVGALERAWPRRLRGVATIAAPVVAAGAVVGAGWVLARALRGSAVG